MPERTVVTRVWIEPGCIGCDACRQICPELFELRGQVCVVHAEGRDPKRLHRCSGAIMDAARDCPVRAIRFEASLLDSPGEPAVCACVSRRGLISSAGIGGVALGGSGLLGALAAHRFAFPNVVNEPDPQICIGGPQRYRAMPVGAVDETFRDEGVWLVRLPGRIVALDRRCTHLGCLTRWSAAERQFKCPCHGSTFAQDGVTIAGPAPRALDRLKIHQIGDDLYVDRSKTFQRNTGQWEAPDSFIEAWDDSAVSQRPPSVAAESACQDDDGHRRTNRLRERHF